MSRRRLWSVVVSTWDLGSPEVTDPGQTGGALGESRCVP
jgi:hypothetical protein